ncbi:hypothetical protein ccbrp13_55430 [Ktedonobacteria bacterium brp13]|nr:hypothetical protein ccbrp13_55430 [Ktedonobacteria bacterium brp13]
MYRPSFAFPEALGQELTIWTDLSLSAFAIVELLATLAYARNSGRYTQEKDRIYPEDKSLQCILLPRLNAE